MTHHAPDVSVGIESIRTLALVGAAGAGKTDAVKARWDGWGGLCGEARVCGGGWGGGSGCRRCWGRRRG